MEGHQFFFVPLSAERRTRVPSTCQLLDHDSNQFNSMLMIFFQNLISLLSLDNFFGICQPFASFYRLHHDHSNLQVGRNKMYIQITSTYVRAYLRIQYMRKRLNLIPKTQVRSMSPAKVVNRPLENHFSGLFPVVLCRCACGAIWNQKIWPGDSVELWHSAPRFSLKDRNWNCNWPLNLETSKHELSV